jgi:hypothetical protein
LPISGTLRTIGSFVRSSWAREYRVSTLGLTTSVKVWSGNVWKWANWLIGALCSPAFGAAVVSCRVMAFSTSG